MTILVFLFALGVLCFSSAARTLVAYIAGLLYMLTVIALQIAGFLLAVGAVIFVIAMLLSGAT